MRTLDRPHARHITLMVLATALIAAVGVAPAPATASVGRGGLTWILQQPPKSPPNRAAPAMAFDPAVGKVVLFGGYDRGGYLDDTWTWDGFRWRPVATSAAPPARAGAGMAYDGVTGQLVLFGGYDGSAHLGDTWAFDAATRSWIQQQPAHGPRKETGAMLFTDPLDGHVDMFGGFDGMLYSNATWRWTGSDWNRLRTTDAPAARSAAATGLDPETGQVVLFAGLGSLRTDDTWTWDGKRWTPRSPTQQPPWRFYAAADVVPSLGGVVMFGGASPDGDLGDTWLWTGSDWTELSPATSPSPRESAAVAYDPASGELVLVGGQSFGKLSHETWTLAG